MTEIDHDGITDHDRGRQAHRFTVGMRPPARRRYNSHAAAATRGAVVVLVDGKWFAQFADVQRRIVDLADQHDIDVDHAGIERTIVLAGIALFDSGLERTTAHIDRVTALERDCAIRPNRRRPRRPTRDASQQRCAPPPQLLMLDQASLPARPRLLCAQRRGQGAAHHHDRDFSSRRPGQFDHHLAHRGVRNRAGHAIDPNLTDGRDGAETQT